MPGLVLHALNRGARRQLIFGGDSDYVAWLALLSEAKARFPVQVYAYCLMPNHYHLVVRSLATDAVPKFMYWLQMTHSKRWRSAHDTKGQGAVYQGRYRAFPVQHDGHFLTVCRYVERNALRAGLVARAEDWPWSSLFERCKNSNRVGLDSWPVPQPLNWTEIVNEDLHQAELKRLRKSVQQSTPFGEIGWMSTGNAGRRGRPRKITSGVFLQKA